MLPIKEILRDMELKYKFALTLEHSSSHENGVQRFHKKYPGNFPCYNMLHVVKVMMRRVPMDGPVNTNPLLN